MGPSPRATWPLSLLALVGVQCIPRGAPFPPPPEGADGNAYSCEISCLYDTINILVDTEWFQIELAGFLTEQGIPLDCLTGFGSGCNVGTLCFSEDDVMTPSAALAGMACTMKTDEMENTLNENDGVNYECAGCCTDGAGNIVLIEPSLLSLMTVGGTGEDRTCYSASDPGDVIFECGFRLAEWADQQALLGFPREDCGGLFTGGPTPICSPADPMPGGTGGAFSLIQTTACILTAAQSWTCTGSPTPTDIYPTSELDCVVAMNDFMVVCSGSPERDTDRKFAIDVAASSVNVFQPEETTLGGVTCARSLVGTTSLSGDLWLNGGFCPGASCPVTIGDFDWGTTSTLDLGRICDGMDLGDVPLARLRAIDVIDLMAEPGAAGTNTVAIAPADFIASLTFVSGGGVQGIELENEFAQVAILDDTTSRVVIDMTFLQDLLITSREFVVHLEATLVNRRPIADAGPDRTAGCGEAVTLVSASTDPDGASDLRAFSWAAVDPQTGALLRRGSGPTTTVRVLETTEFVLTVVDGSGATDQDSVVVTAPATDPPTIESVTVTPACLWPPRHDYVPFSLGQDIVVVTSGGVCGGLSPLVRIIGVASDEPDDGAGDGHTTNDIVFSDRAVCVRSERSGGGDGRVYTVTVEAVDVLGRTAVGSAPIVVPHDRRSDDGCESAPTFVADDDPRCAFGAPLSAEVDSAEVDSAEPSCTVSRFSLADRSPQGIVGLLVGLLLWARRRRQ